MYQLQTAALTSWIRKCINCIMKKAEEENRTNCSYDVKHLKAAIRVIRWAVRGSQWGGTSTATAPIQKIIQKKSESGKAWEVYVITHACVYLSPVVGAMSQPAFVISHRFSSSMQIFFKEHLTWRFFFFFFTQGNSGRHSPAVNPERHPWKHHHECGREVRLQQEEEDVASQCEVDVETIVPACEHSKTPAQEGWNRKAPGLWRCHAQFPIGVHFLHVHTRSLMVILWPLTVVLKQYTNQLGVNSGLLCLCISSHHRICHSNTPAHTHTPHLKRCQTFRSQFEFPQSAQGVNISEQTHKGKTSNYHQYIIKNSFS